MLSNLIQAYQSLNEIDKQIVHCLALSRLPLNAVSLHIAVDKKVKVLRPRIQSVIDQGLQSGLIRKHPFSKEYLIDTYLLIWLYPLIGQPLPQEAKNAYSFYNYNTYFEHKYMLNYLEALFYNPPRVAETEKEFVCYGKSQIACLSVMFLQPAYDPVIPMLSGCILKLFHDTIIREITKEIAPLEQLHVFYDKLSDDKLPDLACEQAEIAFRQGDFAEAEKLSSPYDHPIACFAAAALAFTAGKTDDALAQFEKGLKKQRRIHKDTHVPVLPEAALFYLTAWLTREQKEYMPVFKKILAENIHYTGNIYHHFKQMCQYCTGNVEDSKETASEFQHLTGRNPEYHLWSVIALGFTGKRPVEDHYSDQAAELTRQAFDNGYFVAAYEAACALLQWNADMPGIRPLYKTLSKKLGYKPALSQIKHVEDWERQLNSFLSLEAVQSVIRQETGNGKTRVAYRYYPDRHSAVPILQTRSAGKAWTAGRNIALSNFVAGKVDCMTAHDRRIAGAENSYSYILGRQALHEMVGHPHVFLGDSDIHVELVAAQPTLSVVKASDGGYKIKCDVTDTRNDILIAKETNTRYKVYVINRSQREIIQAVSKSKKMPEQGRDKLLQVLKLFSAYMDIQSDMSVDDSGSQVRQVDADARIRVQLLPMGDGLKAELFVKPFGSHPPYCKPGRGGKTLIANENGERVQVTRRIADENTHHEAILNDIQSIESSHTENDLIAFDDPLDSLELLDVLQNHHDIAVVEWPEGERYKIRRAVAAGDLSLRVRSGVSWFELEGELKIDEEQVVSIKTLLELIRNSHGRFVELSDGEFLSLSEQLKRRLAEWAACSSESGKGVVINRFASAAIMDSFDEFEHLKVDKAWRDFRKRLLTIQQSDAAVPSLLQAELRPYQTAGYRWMVRLADWGAGACLADDMGLGKTIQAIAVLLHRAQAGPAMVVSPVSVMPNWISEVNRFAPSLTIKTLYDGDRAAVLASLEAGDLLVASYGLLLSEETAVTAIHWTTVVLDEAHAIKNYNTKTSKAAMSLQADFRVILTGTPVQNHLGEMWNLFQFVNPGLLGSLNHFTDTFIKPADGNARKRLKKLIAPFILRRTKTAVLEELPPKTEIIKKITLSNEEMAFYETLRRKALELLADDHSPQGAKHLRVLAEITRLRQACCNPALVAPEIAIESTKLSTFLEIASELKDNGHRALVFSQFVSNLSLVRKALDKAGFTYQYLDGSTPLAKREAAVRNFQHGEGDLFLISLKAGGLGLNLTAADYVIHLDPWWNPAIEDQASDRAYRIGQSRPVTVYRLVAEHTIEEKIIQLHNTKRDLADSLLEGSDQSARMSISELMALING
ncbi:MAG: DEAD/DEAH box helicase [Tannerella sp.]|jgi:superfamily II DNA or RNA helicase|nr:DEAD/DEAH box helicase [Tannerella sp.]